jgi:hypothetical protein
MKSHSSNKYHENQENARKRLFISARIDMIVEQALRCEMDFEIDQE